jgi:hypothetical protein
MIGYHIQRDPAKVFSFDGVTVDYPRLGRAGQSILMLDGVLVGKATV